MTQNQDIRNNYLQRINDVLTYIQENLGKSFQLKELSEIGSFSPFHFHRIITAYLGEPLGSYIKRKRLEKAAQLLLFTNNSIVDISVAVGYETSSSFSSAFSKHFQTSPTNYRQKRISQTSTEKMEAPSKINFDFQPTILSFPSTKVAFVRTFGPYGSESTGKAWDTLLRFATEHNLLNDKTNLFGISYDNPEITLEDTCEYNACISIEEVINPSKEIGVKELKGGKYAVFSYKGSYVHFAAVYGLIFKEWLLKSEYELREAEVFDRYVHSPTDTDTNNLLTEIYLPIK